MSTTRVTLLLLLGLALPGALAAPVAADDADAQGNYVQQALSGLEVGEPIITDRITLYPLLTSAEVGDVGVDAAPGAIGVGFGEPELPKKRYDVTVRNDTPRPLLVLGGMILEGGERDRLIRQSAIVAPSSETDVRALPASSSSDRRKVAVPFRVAESVAPSYLIQKAEFGGSANTVTTFISRWLDFRVDGDKRKSLVAIATSEKLKSYCLPCHEAASSFPISSREGKTVVGAVGVIMGRIQGLYLFGNNDLLKACFPYLLKGATYPAAAIELKASKAGVPMPAEEGDLEATREVVEKEIAELLEHLAKASYRDDDIGKGQVGDALLLRTRGGDRGRAVGFDGKLVELAIFPHDPFKNALYGGSFDVPDEELQADPERVGRAELERRARAGRPMTAYEKRLLDRLRRTGPNVPNVPTGPRGPSGPPRPNVPGR